MGDSNGDSLNGNNNNNDNSSVPLGGGEDGGGGVNSSASFKQRRGSKPASSGNNSPKVGEKPTRRKVNKSSGESSKLIKYLALFLLVAQMVGLVLLMRYTRTHQEPDQPLYIASTAVFIMEGMKCVICLMVITYQSNFNLLGELNRHIIHSPYEVLKLCVPSLLYTIQNNLLYIALTNLDAATYQVCYQLKILTTALFSALILGRTFSKFKWLSIVILTIGVAIVQVSGSSDSHSKQQGTDDVEDSSSSMTMMNGRFVGLICVFCAACTSGFSGVYFEKILKGSTTSLWIRNVQMGIPSVIIAYITSYLKDASQIQSQGFLGGYNTLVWIVIVVQAAGGLIVAVVVKYADNVAKVFATSFSIVLSCVISMMLFDFQPTFLFIVGAALVVVATIMYSSPSSTPPKKKPRLGAKKTSPILPMTAKN